MKERFADFYCRWGITPRPEDILISLFLYNSSERFTNQWFSSFLFYEFVDPHEPDPNDPNLGTEEMFRFEKRMRI